MPAVSSSRVHPRYKTEYRVRNWPKYEQGLRDRGDLTVWLSEDAIENWLAKSTGTPGGQRTYSDLAVETSLTLRTLFRLPLRQTEGFTGSLLRMLRLDLSAPDHSTLSRRAKTLKVRHRPIPTSGPIHLMVDSTGLKISGHGPWAAAKHGAKGTREWKKLHIGVNGRGFIIAHDVTESNVDDASVVPDLLNQISSDIDRFTADGAYDTAAVYEALNARGATRAVSHDVWDSRDECSSAAELPPPRCSAALETYASTSYAPSGLGFASLSPAS